MPETAFSYVPIDRRVALAAGRELPTTVHGTALDADLSGFTVLTESLASQYGEQRGAEELARRLNVMYDGLIATVHAYGGSVLGFAGDAFSAWFDGDDGMRAAGCGVALQSWLANHGETASGGIQPARLKVAIATGTARRFLVGDPSVQLMEGLAGALVDELAAAGHDAEPGQVVLAESCRRSLIGRAVTSDRRVLEDLVGEVAISPWPELDESADDRELVRHWLLPAVYSRLQAGEGNFLAELRPATALFMRMSGIAYETDPDALTRLDTFIRGVQAVLASYEGTLVQLTIGDKGSYLYAAFGAPVAHEDDQRRALLAALELRDVSQSGAVVDPVSIGIASGRLRAGSYGGSQRCTYGVLGDTVNLAARLMQAAGPGEIVTTQVVRDSAGGAFEWASLGDLTVKGKREPIPVARLVRERTSEPRRSSSGNDRTPMLGRAPELVELEQALARAVEGQGQAVAIVADAGMGKSRLVAEFVGRLADRGIDVIESECPSYGVNSSYTVWRRPWQQLLAVPESGTAVERGQAVVATLTAADPTLAGRAPVLSSLLGFEIPDNDLTGSLDGRVRKTALESLLSGWLRATVRRPLVIVLEDCHWIDPLSEDLLETIVRSARELPVLVIATLRARDEVSGGPLNVSGLSTYREIVLDRLSDRDVERLIQQRVADAALSPTLAAEVPRLAARAEGNPFYVEELLGWILELGDLADDPARLAELPSTLQSLVLSRVDRLAERPRSTLKVASAVGRVFAVDLLSPVHEELGSTAQVRDSVMTLQRGDFVVVEDATEDLYGFRHAITQEVAYSTLVEATRAALHGQIGRELARRADDDGQILDVLAYHFARSDDDDSRRTYVLRAAGAAELRSAYRAAVAGFRNVLELLADGERIDTLLSLGRTLSLLGQYTDAEDAFAEALAIAADLADATRQAKVVTEQGELARKQGRYDDAEARFAAAREALENEGNQAGEAEVLHLSATLAAQRGDTAGARNQYEQSLRIRRDLGDRRGVSRALNGLGIVAEYENDLAQAATRYAEALEILVELGDRWGVAALTNNTGYALLLQGRAADALPYFDRAVELQREIGDPSMLANFLSNLGDAARELDQLARARDCYDESLRLARDLEERWLVTYLLEDVALLAAREGDHDTALRLAAAGTALRREIGAPLPADSQARLNRGLAPSRAALSEGDRVAAEAAGDAIGWDAAVSGALVALSAL